MLYQGSCHCGAINFRFSGEEIKSGLRCNCSLCERKGAVMTTYTVPPEEMEIIAEDDTLGKYEFDSKTAKHYFCKKCGIYTFHQTLRKPGQYRVNLGCIKGIAASTMPYEIFDGASL
ncbi:GFA family protein [Catenovulum sp. SM1970]|uniref:GFA family protein n=1 Tax=Marinifaba aquimaris TaxID=2741323 RepID=UPI001573636E|nr:GFA family protein [Marinifaba aquimaris]NTS76784.1 GFA family protein [Marinifaba aquimaris]